MALKSSVLVVRQVMSERFGEERRLDKLEHPHIIRQRRTIRKYPGGRIRGQQNRKAKGVFYEYRIRGMAYFDNLILPTNCDR